MSFPRPAGLFSRLPPPIAVALLLAVLSLAFWKLRILDSGVNPAIEVGPVDLYIEQIPHNEYGFAALRNGHLPLWNPYQFCGEPFLAMPFSVLFYPPRLINLVFSAPTAIEISFVLHMFLGALSVWCLARHFGISSLGGLCAAVTFVWSGWMIFNNILPGAFESHIWMPVTILLVDLVLEGAGLAWLWLILAFACQLVLGVMEIFIHVMYAAGLFAVCRVVEMCWRGVWSASLRGVGRVVACLAAAVLLAAPQLLPTIELAQQSTRAAGSLTYAQAVMWAQPPLLFLWKALRGIEFVTVGVLPLLGLGLVIGWRRYRVVWIAGTLAAVGAALLVFGEPAYRYYFAIPVIGGMFRRPMKFLDIYTFAQSVLVGLAVTRLQIWSDIRRRELWLHPGWLAALAVGVAGLVWLASLRQVNWYWVAGLALLLLFGLARQRAARLAVVVALCVVQGASLFFTTGDTHMRPVKRPEIFHTYQDLLDTLKQNLGDARVYLSPKFLFWPGLTAKQGLLNKMAVAIDYEPLALGRYARFFTTITPSANPEPFAGAYYLQPDSRWRLMDLTGTKYFVMLRGEPGDVFMSRNQPEFRLIYDQRFARVYEKQHVLPRAYFVSRARTLSNPDAVLAALDAPSFDPLREVLLEEPESEPLPAPAAEASAAVHITRYEPERVEIEVDATGPGYLVLGDLHYPGWKASVGNREVPIRRANYLFRAVHLDSGAWQVRFEYRPGSFRLGIILAASSAIVVACFALWRLRRPRVNAGNLTYTGVRDAV